MSITAFITTWNPLFEDDGTIAAFGLLDFYSPGTTQRKAIYSSPTLDVELANQFTLDDSGRGEIWLSGSYDVVASDALGNVLYTRDNINPSDSADSGVNLVSNGSFEINTLGDSKTPDSWTLTEEAGSTESLDSDSAAGSVAMKFVSTGSGGGNVETTTAFEVAGGDILTISWQMKSDVVDVRNLVTLEWFDAAMSSLSTDTLYDEAAANPTSYTRQILTATAPATARFGKLKMYGAHPSDATAGYTLYDAVEVYPSSIGGAFVSGTVMVFAQAAAPAGWTRVTSFNDVVLRVVSAGTPGVVGGNTWTITGLSGSSGGLPNHLHSDGSLQVVIPDINRTFSAVAAASDIADEGTYQITGNTGNPTTNPAISVSVSQSGAWRPPVLDTLLAARD